jgi:hypothetical protein
MQAGCNGSRSFLWSGHVNVVILVNETAAAAAAARCWHMSAKQPIALNAALTGSSCCVACLMPCTTAKHTT